jgi:hypothetical protein
VGGSAEDFERINTVVLALRRTPAVQKLWADFRTHAANLAGVLQPEMWACALEVCCETLFNEATVRLHCHFAARRRVAADGEAECGDLQRAGMGVLEFQGSQPHASMASIGQRARGMAAPHMYYLTAPKVGAVFAETTARPFAEFPVNPAWVTLLVQQGKMPPDVGREQLVYTGANLTRRLADYDKWSREVRLVQHRAARSDLDAQLASQLRPFRRIPEVDAWWNRYSRGAHDRKPFLVLEGPSRVGKTAFARALSGEPNATLELNCANVKALQLTMFQPGVHRVMLWDELAASLVVAEKKVFQAPNVAVDLGVTNTCQYVYWVDLSATVHIICSNRWSGQVAQLDPEDRQWVEANQTLVAVTEPLWLQ